MRFKFIKITIFASFFIIALNLFYVQIIRGPYYYNLSKNNRIRVVPIEGRRGRIIDRNKNILAESRLSFNVMVIPQAMRDKQKLFEYLGEVLGEDTESLLKTFKRKMFAPFAPVVVAADIKRSKAMILEENKFRFPGLLIQAGSRRWYPYREVNAHVLGYVGKINRSKMERLKEYGYTSQSIIGYSGVEEQYDKYLQGTEGGLQIEVNSRGEQVQVLSTKESARGTDVTLTIDHRIQKIAHDLLKGRRGGIVVMDMDTGEILAMTSAPAFDPNIFVNEQTRGKSSALFSDPQSPLLNRTIGGRYPPGSVFKIVLASATLETGTTGTDEEYSCPGYYKLGRRRFRCAHVHGVQDLHQGIVHSCNVYFYNLGLVLGPDAISKYARIFELGRPTEVDLPYETKGSIPSRSKRMALKNRRWYKGDTLNLSIGQGDVLATPLQLVRFMASIGSDGKMVQPYIVKAAGSEFIKKKSVKDLNIKKDTLKIIQSGIRGVVEDPTGTAHRLNIEGLSVSGKTGTAQTSGQKKHHAWFVGYSTGGKSKIAFCVFLEHGGSSYYAVSVAKMLLERMKQQGLI